MESMLYKHFYNKKHAKQIKSQMLVGTKNHLNIATDSTGCKWVGIHCPDPDISGGKGRATLSGLTPEVLG